LRRAATERVTWHPRSLPAKSAITDWKKALDFEDSLQRWTTKCHRETNWQDSDDRPSEFAAIRISRDYIEIDWELRLQTHEWVGHRIFVGKHGDGQKIWHSCWDQSLVGHPYCKINCLSRWNPDCENHPKCKHVPKRDNDDGPESKINQRY
jgi:hypothetical protein